MEDKSLRTRNVSKGQGCPRCCKVRILSQTKAKDNFMNKGQSLWKPQDDMDPIDINSDVFVSNFS